METDSRQRDVVQVLGDTLLDHLAQGVEYLEELLENVGSGESRSVADVRLATYLSIANRLDAEQLAALERDLADDASFSAQLDELIDRAHQLDSTLSDVAERR